MKYSYVLRTFSTLKNTYLASRALCSKVPLQPVQSLGKTEEIKDIVVDKNTIALLERLSLVKTDPDEGIKILEDSIAFASQILHLNTANVQPLYSVLEERAGAVIQIYDENGVALDAVDEDAYLAPDTHALYVAAVHKDVL